MTRWVQKAQALSGATVHLWTPEVAMRIEAGELGIAEIKAYIAYLEAENHRLNRELSKYKRLWQARNASAFSTSTSTSGITLGTSTQREVTVE